VQYAYARIRSMLRKELPKGSETGNDLSPLEKQLLITLERFPAIIQQAGQEMNPSVIAGYVFALAKLYNSFYAEHSVLNAENAIKKELRLQLSQMTVQVIQSGMALLGIRVPERM
jgi:arginyl-tRNA synthetase